MDKWQIIIGIITIVIGIVILILNIFYMYIPIDRAAKRVENTDKVINNLIPNIEKFVDQGLRIESKIDGIIQNLNISGQSIQNIKNDVKDAIEQLAIAFLSIESTNQAVFKIQNSLPISEYSEKNKTINQQLLNIQNSLPISEYSEKNKTINQQLLNIQNKLKCNSHHNNNNHC